MLDDVLPPLLADGSRVALLVGRGGEAFASTLRQRHPELTASVYATGGLPAADAAAHLAACDVLVQPYPDGVSARRTTVMAGLALGVPTVTTHGALTEPVWKEDGAVALAPADAPRELVARAEALLADGAERRRLVERATVVYATRFALERTIARLRMPA
jgi:glycosyltransferase involved in cell wall biosynthesis